MIGEWRVYTVLAHLPFHICLFSLPFLENTNTPQYTHPSDRSGSVVGIVIGSPPRGSDFLISSKIMHGHGAGSGGTEIAAHSRRERQRQREGKRQVRAR